jgi:hypothetical protein
VASYFFGNTPESYVEDRDPEVYAPLADVELVILDGVTGDPVTGLADGNGDPADTITTDAYGFWAFYCESPTVTITVTDSVGETTWGPITSPSFLAALAVQFEDLPALVTDILSLIGGAHNTLTGRDLPDQHPIGSITGLQDALGSIPSGVLTLGSAQTVTGVKTFTAKPVVPPDTFPITAITGLFQALNSPLAVERVPSWSVLYVDRQTGSWGAAPGSLPSQRPTSRTDVKFFVLSDVDPVAILAPYDVWLRR